ncbi:MAG: winged helix DNA-binding domain-containing protein, partial [Corynebacteriales bacterium]|nr:winged helix DNA-binding domain-containing protein [Mycobacteriales bacterium]
VVRWLGAVQALDFGQALWAVGSRMSAGTMELVEKAIADGEILRSWPMRGTIHFLPREDARWMVRLLAPRILTKMGRRQRELGLTPDILERAMTLFRESLTGTRLTRAALLEVLEAAQIDTSSGRGYHLLTAAAQSALICLGPLEGKQQTFALLDEWAPGARVLDGNAALIEIARRYFTSHGPATAHDFAHWTALTVTEAKRAIDMAELRSVNVEGKTYWYAELAQPPVESTLLLAGFDEYFLGYKDRSPIVSATDAEKVVPGKNGVFRPTVVANGQVVGTWQRTITTKKVTIAIAPFFAHAARKADLESAANRYAEFVGLPLAKLTIE